MGREIKRVAAGFDWPIRKVWEGFINPHDTSTTCEACGGSGYSPRAREMHAQWYGHAPFTPNKPFAVDCPEAQAWAKHQCERSPGYFGRGAMAEAREAIRITHIWNSCLSHHLNDDDVAALIAKNRLWDLTASRRPSAEEVNHWSLGGFGHDSLNCAIVITDRCRRMGVPSTCAQCHGHGCLWPSEEARQRFETWTETEPPTGEWWQLWETVSEGSPVSPAFPTSRELAQWMASTDECAHLGIGGCLKFIKAGWSPSVVVENGKVISGVEAVANG